MTKQEFDSLSKAAGFGPCADYMWPEIEEVYSTSDDIDKALVVDIYWHEPAIHREILALRREIETTVMRMSYSTKEYQFPEVREGVNRLTDLYGRLNVAITCAKALAKERKEA